MKVEFTNNIIHFKEVESTNLLALNYIKENDLQSSVVFTADFQNFGRGQQSAKWESERGKNLLISIAIMPKMLIQCQFELSVNTSLAILDVLQYYNIKNTSIKWPNDIVVNSAKISGILIENKLRKDKIIHSVLGIGLNVNQIEFKLFNRIATSIKLESNSTFRIDEVRDVLLEKLKIRFSNSSEENRENYLDKLYLKDRVAAFKVKGVIVNGIIKSVTTEGFLVVMLERETRQFKMREIIYLS